MLLPSKKHVTVVSISAKLNHGGPLVRKFVGHDGVIQIFDVDYNADRLVSGRCFFAFGKFPDRR